MTSWRMQLHPNFSGGSAFHSAKSLGAGFVGLDFLNDVGDLNRVNKNELPAKQKTYRAFAHQMEIGDHVLIFCHHYPFALARIDGPYNYILNPEPEIGVWFRHFRRVSFALGTSHYAGNTDTFTYER